jgi:AraC-like DNA-binding protein
MTNRLRSYSEVSNEGAPHPIYVAETAILGHLLKRTRSRLTPVPLPTGSIHQYLISCRMERAQPLLRADGELGLAEVALRVGFSDQSQFSRHFKRILGVTPRQFHISARTR